MDYKIELKKHIQLLFYTFLFKCNSFFSLITVYLYYSFKVCKLRITENFKKAHKRTFIGFS